MLTAGWFQNNYMGYTLPRFQFKVLLKGFLLPWAFDYWLRTFHRPILPLAAELLPSSNT